MPSQPIQPQKPTAPAPTVTAPVVKSAQPNAPKAAGLSNRTAIPASQQKPSPLQKQARDSRFQPDYTPCQIVFLTGAYKGMSLDLGLAVNETSHSETADWQPFGGDFLRAGVNFKQLTPREISLTVTFFSIDQDVSHLVENCKHLKELTDGETAPPRLLFIQGDLRGVECVCTKLSDRYSEPHPNNKGFRKAEVEIGLMLGGGRDSVNAFGGPLTSTPLQDARAKQTDADRKKQGTQQVAQLLLLPCLGAEGNAALQFLIDQNRLNNPAEVAKLDASTLVQASVGGLIPATTLKDEALQAKLRESLALTMAANRDGFGKTLRARAYTNGLLSGDFSALRPSPEVLNQLYQDKKDFDLIYQEIMKQNLNQGSPVFDRLKNPTAAERLIDAASCGLQLRKVGTSAIANKPSTEDAQVLKGINEFLNTKPTDEAIKQKFGLTTETQVRALKNGYPYQDKAGFVSQVSQGGAAITGESTWSSFAATISQPPGNQN